MDALGATWHLLNFLAPAAGIGLISSTLAKLAWRRDLAGVPWRSLAAWSTTGSALAAIAGLWLSGRDGRMSTYLAMVLASAVALWWRCGPRRG